jgi:hypothetical protein
MLARIFKCFSLLALCLLVGLLHLNSALAEVFDYNGGAVIDCICPSALGANDCGVRSNRTEKYSVTISVKRGFNLDLVTDVCIRKRDDTLCCSNPKSSFKASIGKKCVGSSC